MTIIEMTVRTFISFVSLYVMCRILGKKLISQMTFFDFVAGVTLGTITGSIMFSDKLSKSVGVYGLVLFALITLLLDFIALKSLKGRKVLNGEPTLIVKNGKILEEGMSKARLTMDELLIHLRKKNIFYLDEVDFAFFETDGSISSMKKSILSPPTKKDLQVNTASRGVPQVFIMDGKVLPDGIQAAGKDEKWIKMILQSNGITDVGQVAIAQVDEQDSVYIDIREDQPSL
jgi:uncharacterized membrane protein YcaP (DUF421 family)